MTSSVATKPKGKRPKPAALSREEAQRIAADYLFDQVSSFVLPGEPELSGNVWRFPVVRAYATLEERPTVGHLSVDPAGNTAFAKIRS